MAGSWPVTLSIDGVAEDTKPVTLSPGESDTITFTVSRDEAGTYDVALDGLAGSFTVTEEAFPWWALGLGLGLAALLAAAAYLLIWRRKRMA
jgi:hypothetical protein